jgi:hypothetical protein
MTTCIAQPMVRPGTGRPVAEPAKEFADSGR